MSTEKTKHVRFEFLEMSSSGKTKVWEVQTTENNLTLGYIRWFGSWRRYAFFPNFKSVFEWTCLRDIANFCEEKTREHRTNKRRLSK